MINKLKFIIAGAAVIAGLASAVSCQDLSQDVEKLTTRVSTLESSVASLQSKIDAGSVITSVTSSDSGITVTLSNGNSYTITNGEDGEDGADGADGADGKDGANGADGKDGADGHSPVVTIGENGNWFIDGVDTGLTSKGEKGADGDSVVWKIEDGKFVEYKNGEKTGNEVSFADSGILYAVWTDDALTFYNVQGVEGGVVAINTAPTVTDVEVYLSYWGYYGDVTFYFYNVIEQDNVFGDGLEGAITYVEGTNRISQPTQSMLLRVSPASYELQPEDLTFVNSEGTVLEDVTVASAERYDGLLTRTTDATGLWELTLDLNPDLDVDEFLENTVSGTDYILYAAKAKDAVSTYDFSFVYDDDVTMDAELAFTVDDIDVADLNNRYAGTYAAGDNPSLPQGGTTTYDELAWDSEAAVSADDGDTVTDTADDRSGESLFNATLGAPFVIELTGDTPDALYVTFDYEENAIESAPSEWNAWKSYESEIEGLNTVVKGSKIAITINAAAADGDIIGFRVFAANADGTLMDPDGKAFYVQVGEGSEAWTTAATSLSTYADYVTNLGVTPEVDVVPTALASVATYDVEYDDLAFQIVITDEDGTAIIDQNADITDVAITADEVADLALAYVVPTLDLYEYEDGETYSATITFYNANDRVLATQVVTFTKTLPTDYPEGFSVKTSQLDADGKYNCYMVPDDWTADAATAGTMEMTSVFNYPTGEDGSNFIISFAESDTDTDDELISVDVAGNGTLSVDKDYIDNATEHATTVGYNYGDISSELGSGEDYIVTVLEFPTIYNCIYNSTYTWAWDWSAYTGTDITFDGDIPCIVYEDFNGNTVEAEYVAGTSAWDSAYNCTLDAPYNSSVEIDTATLTSNSNGLEEYYTVAVSGTTLTFTAVSGATNPTANVLSTLTLNCIDMYGHDVVITLPMTVLKR